MHSNDFERFRHLVLASKSLQRELRDLTDEDDFVARAVQLGTTEGLHFSRQDVIEAIRVSRREWFEAMI